MEKRKKLVGDITRGYVLMDEDEVTKTQMLCDTIGQYLGMDTRKKEYNKMCKEKGIVFVDTFTIKRVIFHAPATIVYWTDGTKTIVKANKEDFDPEKGLAMAFAKKALGNKGNYFNQIKKWTKQYREDE